MNIEDGVCNLVIEVKMESMDSRQIHMLMESKHTYNTVISAVTPVA